MYVTVRLIGYKKAYLLMNMSLDIAGEIMLMQLQHVNILKRQLTIVAVHGTQFAHGFMLNCLFKMAPAICIGVCGKV